MRLVLVHFLEEIEVNKKTFQYQLAHQLKLEILLSATYQYRCIILNFQVNSKLFFFQKKLKK